MSDSINEPQAPEPQTPSQPQSQPEQPYTFEELNLLDLIGVFVRRPAQTLSALGEMLRRPLDSAEAASTPARRSLASIFDFAEPTVRDDTGRARFELTLPKVEWHKLTPLILPGFGLLLALLGSFVIANARGETQDGFLLLGGPVMLIASIWLVTMIFRSTPELFARPVEPIPALPTEAAVETPVPEPLPNAMAAASPSLSVRIERFLGVNGLRMALLMIGFIWSLAAFAFCSDNRVPAQPAFTNLGVFCWIWAIVTMGVALMDRDPDLAGWARRQVARVREVASRPFSIRVTWTFAALVVILIIGAGYRFNDLTLYPPDMTSDAVEKVLDAVRVSRGDRQIFFPNNGGREPFQFYYLAALQTVTRMPFGFELLKVGSGLEGMVMILLAWWLGRAIFGEEDRQLGNLTGLIMAALVATSYWHTLLSRLGLRIVTTTVVASLVLIFLARALRHNRRIDYIWAGAMLGASIYFYQAARMLPVMVVAGFVLALIVKVRSWKLARSYVLNFSVLVLMALVLFVPMARYMVQFPDYFWERAEGRIFGERTRVNEKGETIAVPDEEQVETFRKNLSILWNNFGKSILMFNWKGDRSWFNGNPDGTPALDFFAGAFFVLGVIAVSVRAFRRRDPIDALLPLGVCIMVLPSALAIAFTIEVPGFTRASGAFPMVYLLAAFGVAITVRYLARLIELRWVRYAVYALLLLCFMWGAHQNSDAYFVRAMNDYRLSTLPHHQAGQILHGFIASTGAPGNAVMIAYKYWWDHRALAIESGDVDWSNTVPERNPLNLRIMELLRANAASNRYAIRTDRQMMFFLSNEDKEAADVLKSMFPAGELIYVTSINQSRDFFLYVVPPVGCDWAKEQLGYDAPECKEKAPLPGAQATGR